MTSTISRPEQRYPRTTDSRHIQQDTPYKKYRNPMGCAVSHCAAARPDPGLPEAAYRSRSDRPRSHRSRGMLCPSNIKSRISRRCRRSCAQDSALRSFPYGWFRTTFGMDTYRSGWNVRRQGADQRALAADEGFAGEDQSYRGGAGSRRARPVGCDRLGDYPDLDLLIAA